MASIGILILMGVVVNNGIVMIEHINQLRHAGILKGIADKKQIDDELKGQITAALKDFSQQFAAKKAA